MSAAMLLGFNYVYEHHSDPVFCSKFKAHDKVCIGVEWNPYHPSGVATCGWDGLIKYWM